MASDGAGVSFFFLSFLVFLFCAVIGLVGLCPAAYGSLFWFLVCLNSLHLNFANL